MQAWTAAELGRFLGWAEAYDRDLAMGWRLLAATGMRRGEALALRWRDVDLDAGRLAVRRSVGVGKPRAPASVWWSGRGAVRVARAGTRHRRSRRHPVCGAAEG